MKHFLTILAAAVFLWPFSTMAQPALEDPPAKFLTRFTFKQYSGGVMIIQAKLDQVPDSLNFILDTGSGGISLDSGTCAQYHLQPVPTDTFITGMGGSHKVSFLFNRVLQLPGLTIPKLNFHVNDYEILTHLYGEKIDGIIGYSFFKKYIVAINFDSLYIDVYTPGKYKYPMGGHILRPAFTNLPMVNLTVKDARKINFRFYFDTGAGLNFLMSEAFAQDSSILLSRRKPVVTQAEGMGGKLKMRLTVVKQLKVGPYRFYNVPTYLYEDDFNVTSYPYLGGVIGNDLLRRFNLVLNYPKRQIHLLPNHNFREPFDYAYTGMAMYFVNNEILIEDVIPESPAEKAGLQKGDILVAVGNVFTNNIMQYKTILQSTIDYIPIIIRRNGALFKKNIRPKSIR